MPSQWLASFERQRLDVDADLASSLAVTNGVKGFTVVSLWWQMTINWQLSHWHVAYIFMRDCSKTHAQSCCARTDLVDGCYSVHVGCSGIFIGRVCVRMQHMMPQSKASLSVARLSKADTSCHCNINVRTLHVHEKIPTKIFFIA